jgi:MOSC domain-containing protein YiiM
MQDSSHTLQFISQNIPQTGRLEAIIVRPARRVPAIQIEHTVAVVDVGLQHDRRYLESTLADKNTAAYKVSNRQVTLIQAEHIEVVAKLMQQPNLNALVLRRNLVVSGINLLAIKPLFKHQTHLLKIGDVTLEVTGICAPCSRMEEVLGEGGYNAMRGHGGVNARIIQGGEISVGDAVKMHTVALQQSLDF